MKNNSLHITYDKDAQMLKTAERMRSTSMGGALIALKKKNPETIKKAVFTDHQGVSTVLRLLIFILLMPFSIDSLAQVRGLTLFEEARETPPPAIYIAYQPWDHGLGVRGDYHFNNWAGVYGSASYGNMGLYRGAGLKDHVKLTAGILIPLKDYMSNQHDISIGLNRHFVNTFEVDDPDNIYNGSKIVNTPWSFEIGLTIKMQRVTLGMRTDILRWEPCIDVGIPLNFKKRYHIVRKFNTVKCR